MKRRVFVKWTLASAATFPLVQCATSPSNEPPETVRLAGVSMNPASVWGGTSSTGTVTLSGAAPTGGVTVVLSGNNATAAQVPANVTVPAGATTTTFTVATGSVAAETPVTITATYDGVTRTAALTVMMLVEGASPIFRVSQIADNAVTAGNRHQGVDALIRLMGQNGLKFYRSSVTGVDRGPQGLIAPLDVVLIKVNAQWKYRGCTNSDVIRGLVRAILDHPDGFQGEVVLFENGQGRGSLNCDTSISYNGNTEVHANAQDESHSFLWLIDHLFHDPRVSGFLLDPYRSTFIAATDHATNGYRNFESVSYPCFTTAGGRRVELREGVWNGTSYDSNLKLINCPVLKTHETGGCEVTGALKHVYGIVTMDDGHSGYRHFSGLGPTCGTMMVSVQTPVLSIMDAIWVSYGSLRGTPASATFRANQLVASQDPVALDYWAAKYVLYPIDNDQRHHPDYPAVDAWLTGARDLINGRDGFNQAAKGVQVRLVTKTESQMTLFETVP
jgi:hypothetical protein